jgi:hypothetical protein
MLCDPSSDRSPLYDVRNHASSIFGEDTECETMFRGLKQAPPNGARYEHSTINSSPHPNFWWRQTGSNRRPHACKARALPAELCPRSRRRMPNAKTMRISKMRCRDVSAATSMESRAKMVGLGRLELPTSRLSSARSNQLSYKP